MAPHRLLAADAEPLGSKGEGLVSGLQPPVYKRGGWKVTPTVPVPPLGKVAKATPSFRVVIVMITVSPSWRMLAG